MKDLNRIGEKFTTNEGFEAEIIKYFNSENITIKLNDNTIIKNITYHNLTKGKVKNKNNKSFYNKGYIGFGIYSTGVYKKVFSLWKLVLWRCYDKNFHAKQKSYSDKTVCEEWHNFQNFAEWYEENWKPWMDKTWQLDKDILIKGNKIYSPETCCFVPHEINSLLYVDYRNKKLPIGVTLSPSGNFCANLSKDNKQFRIGTYKTVREASEAYKTAKESYIKEKANKWKDKIKPQVYNALISYKVEITD